MSRPQNTGLVDLIDEKETGGIGFACMKLIAFLVEEYGYPVPDNMWRLRHQQARIGRCYYRHGCPIYEKTMDKTQNGMEVKDEQARNNTRLLRTGARDCQD